MNLGPYALGYNDSDECGIYTGDARELAQGVPDESVDLIFTDPVYQNIDDYRWLAETAARVLRPGGALLAYSSNVCLPQACAALMTRLQYRGVITHHLVGGRNMVHYRTIYNGAWLIWCGGHPIDYSQLVWDSPSIQDSLPTFHWQKGRQLVPRHIRDWTERDAVVLDTFCGSGTVPSSCKMLDRRYLAFEIDADTADRARARVRQTQAPLFTVEPTQFEMAI